MKYTDLLRSFDRCILLCRPSPSWDLQHSFHPETSFTPFAVHPDPTHALASTAPWAGFQPVLKLYGNVVINCVPFYVRFIFLGLLNSSMLSHMSVVFSSYQVVFLYKNGLRIHSPFAGHLDRFHILVLLTNFYEQRYTRLVLEDVAGPEGGCMFHSWSAARLFPRQSDHFTLLPAMNESSRKGCF